MGLAAVAAFAPSLAGGYVQDDGPALVSNAIAARGDLQEILTTDYWAGGAAELQDRFLYRPVTVLSFALEHRWGELDPRRSHAINLGLHAVASMLLSGLAWRLGGSVAHGIVAGLAFAVHPVHTAPVANVAARTELLATAFGLAACVALGHGRSRWQAWTAGGLALGSLGSKEVALALPPLLALQVLLFPPADRESGRARVLRRLGALAPTALAVVVYLVLRTAATGVLGGRQNVLEQDNPLPGLAGEARWATTLALLARAAGLILWPARLSGDYSGAAIPVEPSLLALRPLAGAAVAVLLLALALLPALPALRATRHLAARLASFGASLVLLPWLIVGNVVAIIGVAFAERLLYLPSAGACWLLGLAAAAALARARGPSRRWRARLAWSAIGALAIAATVHARAQSRLWQDEPTMFRAALAAQPGSVRAPFALGRMSLNRGEPDAALPWFVRATETWPDHGAAWIDRGLLEAQAGRFADAERSLREAIRIAPDYGESRMLLGMVLARQGRLHEARRELRRALLLMPGLVKAAAQLAHVEYDLGNYGEAARLYRRCVDLGRSDLAGRLADAEARAVSLPAARRP